MARVTLSGIITDINGSVNGWTFQNSLVGKTLRSKPIQTRSPNFVRRAFEKIPQTIRFLWQQTTPTQKTDWANFAAATVFTDIWGNIKTLSAYQFFMSCITRYLLQGTLTSLDAPIGIPATDAMPPFDLTLNPTTLELTFASTFNKPDHQIWVFVSIPTSEPGDNNRHKYKLVTTRANPNASTLDITGSYEARFTVNYADLFSQDNFYLHAYCFLVREDNGIASLAVKSSAHN